MRPSRDMASLARTRPRPRVIRATKPGITWRASPLQQATVHRDTGGAQFLQPLPGHQRIGVLHGRYHPADPRIDQGICAGPGLALMATGFQGHIGSGAASIPRRLQGLYFRVVAARRLGKALADHLPVAHQHTTHMGVGHGRVLAPPRQLQGARHHSGIETESSHGSGCQQSVGGFGLKPLDRVAEL